MVGVLAKMERHGIKVDREYLARLSKEFAEDIAALDPAISRLLPEAGRNDLPGLSRVYPADFRADAAYKATMPDLQNGPESLILGARRGIQLV